MSLKQDRTGTRTSEDLRRRLNVTGIEQTKEKADASAEQVQNLSNQVDNLNNQLKGLNTTVKDTRETYVSTNAQTFTDEQRQNARQNIGAGTSSFSGYYKDLRDKPAIPTKTSQLENDSGFITDSGSTTPAVESGSNSNGEYTKFADGTLICTGTATVDSVPAGNGADIIVALPHNFINQEYRILLQKRFCGAYYSFVIENITFKNLHDFGIGCWNNLANNDSGTINWDYTAIGKWK